MQHIGDDHHVTSSQSNDNSQNPNDRSYSINFGLRQGIELIDGLLLCGKPVDDQPQVYEINLETPDTLKLLYERYPSFIPHSFVTKGLEQGVKESFQEADWDDDNDTAYPLQVSSQLLYDPRHGNYSDSSAGIDLAIDNALPSGCQKLLPISPKQQHPQHSPFFHQWPRNPFMKLTTSSNFHNKQYSPYKLVKSIELLYKKSNPHQIADFQQYQKDFRDYLLKLAGNRSDAVCHEKLQMSNSNKSPFPCHQNQLHCVTAEASSTMEYRAPHSYHHHYIQPPSLPDSLDQTVKDALLYQANNHNMFCLTIRNVTRSMSDANSFLLSSNNTSPSSPSTTAAMTTMTATATTTTTATTTNAVVDVDHSINANTNTTMSTQDTPRASYKIFYRGAITNRISEDIYSQDIIQSPQGHAMIITNRLYTSDRMGGVEPIQSPSHITPISESPVCGIVFGRFITSDEMLKWARQESVLDPQMIVPVSSSKSTPSMVSYQSSYSTPYSKDETPHSRTVDFQDTICNISYPNDHTMNDCDHDQNDEHGQCSSSYHEINNNDAIIHEPEVNSVTTLPDPKDTSEGLTDTANVDDDLDSILSDIPVHTYDGLLTLVNNYIGEECLTETSSSNPRQSEGNITQKTINTSSTSDHSHGTDNHTQSPSQHTTLSGLDILNINQLAQDVEKDICNQKPVVFYIPLSTSSEQWSVNSNNEKSNCHDDAATYNNDSIVVNDNDDDDDSKNKSNNKDNNMNSSLHDSSTEPGYVVKVSMDDSNITYHNNNSRFIGGISTNSNSHNHHMQQVVDKSDPSTISLPSPLSSLSPSPSSSSSSQNHQHIRLVNFLDTPEAITKEQQFMKSVTCPPESFIKHHLPPGGLPQCMVNVDSSSPHSLKQVYTPQVKISPDCKPDTGSSIPRLSSESSRSGSSKNPQHWVKIELIATLPEHQNRGIATLLLISSFLASVLSTRLSPHPSSQRINHSILNIAGGQKNHAATQVYRQLGFIPIDQSMFNSPNRDLFILFRLDKALAKIQWGELVAGLHSVE